MGQDMFSTFYLYLTNLFSLNLLPTLYYRIFYISLFLVGFGTGFVFHFEHG